MSFDPTTHRLVSVIVNEDGTVSYEVEALEQPIELPHHDVFHAKEWISVRKQRDLLLSKSDWVVARSAETGQPIPQDWADYRQALRDITSQRNPFLIVWPQEPANISRLVTEYNIEDLNNAG
jgi:hypothetical protein